MGRSRSFGSDADDKERLAASLLGQKPQLPLWSLIAITLPWFGVQFSWSAEFATQTSYILSLGVPKTFTTWTWAAGAVTGFLVQPIVGSFSDRCESRFGRRRPFLIGGMVATVGSQLLYAWSKEIGELFGDTVGHRPVGITVAIVAVWLLGCAINVIQTPLRAIVADVAAEEQQETGQSLASIFQALGGIVGFLVSYIWYPVAIMRPYFVASSVTLVVTTIITCCVAKEAQHKNEETISGCCNSIGRVFTDVFRGIGMMPVGMRRICILQFCTWGAWFMFNPNWPAWMGSFIYGGSPQHPGTAPTAANLRYKRGSQLGGLGQAIAAGVQCVCSFAMPKAVKVFGLRQVYVACFVVFMGTFFGMGFLKSAPEEYTNYPAVILIAATGLPLAATNIFPFSIIGRDFGTDPNLALYMGALNIFIVLPQLADTLYAGKVATSYGWNIVLLIGAGWTVLATLAIFFLRFSPVGGRKRGAFGQPKNADEAKKLVTGDPLGEVGGVA